MGSFSRAVLALVGGMGLAQSAGAQEIRDPQFGVSLGYSSRFEKPVWAAEFVLPVYAYVDLDASFQFIDRDSVRRYVANADVQFRFPIQRLHPRAFGWGGAGFGLITDDPKGPLETTTRDGQLNVFAGIAYDGPATPYFELRVTRKHEVIVGVGVRF
jgi:hypothetical protein